MRQLTATAFVVAAALAATWPLRAQNRSEDEFTRYELLAPETSSFKIVYDVTAVSPGARFFFNPIRYKDPDPSAKILDTGEALKVETLKGQAITAARIDIGEAVRPESEAVVIRFPPVKEGQSVRLRIEETYTDPARYDLIDGQLMWRRSFGRPRNDMVLPAGWYLTASSIPATITPMEDGRVRLAFVNPRPDTIDVFVKGRPR